MTCSQCLERPLLDGMCVACGFVSDVVADVTPEDPLEDLSKKELLAIVKDIPEITGESKMNKAELIEAIKANRQ